MHTQVSISFSASLYMRMYAQKPQLTPILSYLEMHIFFWISIFILLMLLRICAGSPEAMQLTEKSHDIVQSPMNLCCSREKCDYI